MKGIRNSLTKRKGYVADSETYNFFVGIFGDKIIDFVCYCGKQITLFKIFIVFVYVHFNLFLFARSLYWSLSSCLPFIIFSKSEGLIF